jgi:hypothetical protein
MKRDGLSRYQRGYLYEVPVILFVLLLALALILPHLSVLEQKVLLGVTTIPILGCLFYLIVRPGQTAAAPRRGHIYGRIILFLACAVAASAMVARLFFASRSA